MRGHFQRQFRIHSLVKNEHHSVVLFNRSAEGSFQETVGAHRLLYVSSQSVLRDLM
jgi:hypothetical protein